MKSLDRAVSALKSEVAGGPGIPAAARSRIAAACYDDLKEPLESFRPTFQPRPWLSVLALAPVVVAAIAVLNLRNTTQEPVAPLNPMFVAAMKYGSEVVFEVADGKGPHTVVKSTNPASFNPAAGTVTEDGRYADLAESGPVIVFYRID